MDGRGKITYAFGGKSKSRRGAIPLKGRRFKKAESKSPISIEHISSAIESLIGKKRTWTSLSVIQALMATRRVISILQTKGILLDKENKEYYKGIILNYFSKGKIKAEIRRPHASNTSIGFVINRLVHYLINYVPKPPIADPSKKIVKGPKVDPKK